MRDFKHTINSLYIYISLLLWIRRNLMNTFDNNKKKKKSFQNTQLAESVGYQLTWAQGPLALTLASGLR